MVVSVIAIARGCLHFRQRHSDSEREKGHVACFDGDNASSHGDGDFLTFFSLGERDKKKCWIFPLLYPFLSHSKKKKRRKDDDNKQQETDNVNNDRSESSERNGKSGFERCIYVRTHSLVG